MPAVFTDSLYFELYILPVSLRLYWGWVEIEREIADVERTAQR